MGKRIGTAKKTVVLELGSFELSVLYSTLLHGMKREEETLEGIKKDLHPSAIHIKTSEERMSILRELIKKVGN